MLAGRLALLGLALTVSMACVAVPVARSGVAPASALELSQAAVSPGTSIRIQATGFRVAEYVELRVTDPAGSQTTIGRVIADGRGDVDAEVAPGPAVTNGTNLLSASGTVSGVTVAAPLTVTGGSGGGPVTGQPQWTVSSGSEETSCEQCLLVHGQAP